jgi:hypothetical protein
LSWGRTSVAISDFLILLISFLEPFTPFTSLRVAVLRERLSEGGGVCEVSDVDSFGCVRLRDVATFDVLDASALEARAVREEVREGALGLGGSMEACERLRDGMGKNG